jgi:hypothetical protein
LVVEVFHCPSAEQEEVPFIMNISTLKEFYDVMAESKGVRSEIVLDLFAGRRVPPSSLQFLENCHSALLGIGGSARKGDLQMDGRRSIQVDLSYEISELHKDLIYLKEGEKAFVDHLEGLHQGYSETVRQGAEELGSLAFNCLITDRDGTTNNYCGRYRTSIQSVWNAVFLTRFAKKRTEHPVIITSGPLKNGGILNVSTNPEGAFIYAASKGRECLDLSGKIHRHPIAEAQQELLDRLNQRLRELVDSGQYELFSLIGSGLQFKFGQSTIARQDISRSIPQAESEAFLEKVRGVVRELDPERERFRIEDTGLDIEIILTFQDERLGLKDFDKGDAVRFLDKELGLRLEAGPHLVCGDTSSDLPMVRAVMERSEDTKTIFVTKDPDLARRVDEVCPGAIIVPEPDILAGVLNELALVLA